MKKLLWLSALLICMGPGGAYAQNTSASTENKVTVVYFGSPYCLHCRHMEKDFLPGFLERNAGRIEWVRVDVTQNNLAFLAAMERYGVERGGTPALAIGEEWLMGYPSEIGPRADLAVTKALMNGEKTRVGAPPVMREKPAPRPSPARAVQKTAAKTGPSAGNANDTKKIIPSAQAALETPPAAQTMPLDTHEGVFTRLTFWMIAGAGLADGINPCAFAVIVFFISFLSVYKYTRREMAAVGAAYCAAVFVAYVLLGLGAFKFLYAMQGFYYVMWILKALTVLLCAAFLAFSAYDYWHYRRTKDASGLVLQLPVKYKTFIHKTMHAFLKDRQKSVWRLGLASAAVGFIVSLVEAVCTGQVYLPTIVVVLKESGDHFWRAAQYLLFYNLMFIAPLVLVFCLALAGYESKTFGGWLKRHLGAAKLLLCAVFLVLLVLLIKTW